MRTALRGVAEKARYVRAQSDVAHDEAHTCHARGCSRSVPPAVFMCSKHWRMVPRALQHAIWRHFRPGQERDKEPTSLYLAAAKSAIDAVAGLEELAR